MINNKVNKNILTAILAGGLGSRLSEETKKTPKPMIKIGKIPILHHIINIYEKYSFNNFIIMGGYKCSNIKSYFQKKKNVFVKNTGILTMTGGRIYSIKDQILKNNNEDFFLTYGDGVSNIDINKLYKFHKKNQKIATMSVVRPPARWGYAVLNKSMIKKFEEKNQINEGWINGGFFVLNKKIFKYFEKFKTKKTIVFERDILPPLAKQKQLAAYKHKGFWQCMDTLRDKEILENKIKEQINFG